MLRFLFCLTVIAPIFFIPSLTNNQDAAASVEIEEDTYEMFTDSKISALSECQPENIPVYFSDAYVESHSAEFLHAAVDAVENCKDATVHVVNLKFENMTDDEEALARDQVEEVTAFLSAYDSHIEIDRETREAELDTRAVNGRAVVVEFEFDENTTTQSVRLK